jgi:RNA polymerase sigma-70 factor (ECF subfamily)
MPSTGFECRGPSSTQGSTGGLNALREKTVDRMGKHAHNQTNRNRARRFLPMSDTTDHLLLDALQDTTQRNEAWPRFQKRYEGIIISWCRGRGLREEDARDLCQDILMKLWRDLPEGKYDPELGRFRTYLGLVVRSAVNHFLERQANRPGAVGSGGTALLDLLHQVSDDDLEEVSVSIDNTLQADIRAAYDKALERVSEENREVVHRVLLQGEKPVEVARELNRSPTSVFQLIARARGYIREEYEKLLGENRA